MADDPLAEDPNIGLLLGISYHALEGRVFMTLAAAGFDFTPAQARVFQRIRPHGTRLTELSEQAQITLQAAGFLINQLERAGYVERVPDPTDARARLVRVAERGARAIPLAVSVVADVEAEWTAHLGMKQMDQLQRALTHLCEITDPYA